MNRFLIPIFFVFALAFQAGFAMDDIWDDLELDNNALSHELNPAKKQRLLDQDDDLDEQKNNITPFLISLSQHSPITSPITDSNSNNTPITNAAHDPSHNPDFRAALNYQFDLALLQSILNQQNDIPNQSAAIAIAPEPSSAIDATINPQTIQKRYACKYPDCGKSYQSQPSLSRHINDYHTHARQDSCHFCALFPTNTDISVDSTIYFHRSSFLGHLKTHTQPYQCNVQGCTMRYAQEECLKNHQQRTHGSITYARQERDASTKTSPCLMCGLNNISDLSAHKEQCKNLLKYGLRKSLVDDSDENLKKLGFGGNKSRQMLSKRTQTWHSCTPTSTSMAHHK